MKNKLYPTKKVIENSGDKIYKQNLSTHTNANSYP